MCIYLCADVKYADPDFTKWFCMCVYMCIYACVLLSGCAFACVRIYVDYVFNGVCVCVHCMSSHALLHRQICSRPRYNLSFERKEELYRKKTLSRWLTGCWRDLSGRDHSPVGQLGASDCGLVTAAQFLLWASVLYILPQASSPHLNFSKPWQASITNGIKDQWRIDNVCCASGFMASDDGDAIGTHSKEYG